MRGGTSKALVFHARDLPSDRSLWPEIFLAAMGSPDRNRRQLDGMGGGISSLSKVCVVGPPSRADADVDYTFGQVSVEEAVVDFRPNCGNMSSAIGPFAVDEGLVAADGTEATVRIHNTNTHKLIHARFALEAGRAAVDGDLALPGVAGTGAPVQLEFRDPGGATTGALLPTGSVLTRLDVPGVGQIEGSLVDAGNACVFIKASDIGLGGTETPDRLESDPDLLNRLAAIRTAAAVAMGLAGSAEATRQSNVPLIGFVSGPQAARTLAGQVLPAADADLTARMISMGRPHRALPLTGALCLAVAACIEGSIVHQVVRPLRRGEAVDLRIAMPSGVLVVGAKVRREDARWIAEHGTVLRTARRLFEGAALIRVSRIPELLAADHGGLASAIS